MNTFLHALNVTSAIYCKINSVTKENLVHVMRNNDDVFHFLNRIWPLVTCPEEPFSTL